MKTDHVAVTAIPAMNRRSNFLKAMKGHFPLTVNSGPEPT